eukprot:COSAG06_NODE_763_length_12486_cov_37.835244_8_plen_91_part_00
MFDLEPGSKGNLTKNTMDSSNWNMWFERELMHHLLKFLLLQIHPSLSTYRLVHLYPTTFVRTFHEYPHGLEAGLHGLSLLDASVNHGHWF